MPVEMKLVSNQLGPNFTFLDALHALGCGAIPYLEEADLTPFFETENVRFASVGRTLLGEVAELLDEGKIGIPAVCCAVMATPFLTLGREICWLDVDARGLLDFQQFLAHADELAAVIVPHTFGQDAGIEHFLDVARAKNIVVIEDCAHRWLPGEPLADVRLHSFGREKDVSCVSGGALVWRSDSPLAEKFSNEKPLPHPGAVWVLRHTLQPFVLAVSLPWWRAGGKFIAGLASKLKLLPRAVTATEKSGRENLPEAGLGRSQQQILARALRRRSRELAHRKKLAETWQQVLPEIFPGCGIVVPDNFFRVIVFGVTRSTILQLARSIGWDLGEWDGEPIAPRGVNLEKFGYVPGQCPHAEKFVRHYLTLPTNRRTTVRDIKKFAARSKKFC